jgi:hypothetical protein
MIGRYQVESGTYTVIANKTVPSVICPVASDLDDWPRQYTSAAVDRDPPMASSSKRRGRRKASQPSPALADWEALYSLRGLGFATDQVWFVPEGFGKWSLGEKVRFVEDLQDDWR